MLLPIVFMIGGGTSDWAHRLYTISAYLGFNSFCAGLSSASAVVI
jgi:hypothetical protein